MVRRGWLERGPARTTGAGSDEFVPDAWPEALDLLAAELRRVYAEHGPRRGVRRVLWLGQRRAFPPCAASDPPLPEPAPAAMSARSTPTAPAPRAVILPHVIGPQAIVAGNNVSWDEMVAHSEIVLAFGGMALKNTMSAAAVRASISPARSPRGSAGDGASNFIWSARCATTCPRKPGRTGTRSGRAPTPR